MPHRHPVLYEVERWRTWRPWLLFPATISALTIVFSSFVNRLPASTLTGYALVILVAGVTAAALWIRQRAVYVEVEGEALGLHALASQMSIPLQQLGQPRVAQLGRALAGRQLALPRPRERWAAREAVLVRPQGAAADLGRASRILGARCVVDGSLVVPVADPRSLLAEIAEAMPAGGAAVSTSPPRRRGTRRRRR